LVVGAGVLGLAAPVVGRVRVFVAGLDGLALAFGRALALALALALAAGRVLAADRVCEVLAAQAGVELLLYEGAEVADRPVLLGRLGRLIEQLGGVLGGQLLVLGGGEAGLDVLLVSAGLAQQAGLEREIEGPEDPVLRGDLAGAGSYVR